MTYFYYNTKPANNHNKAVRKYQKDHIAKGLCQLCPKKLVNATLCFECNEKRKQRRKLTP